MKYLLILLSARIMPTDSGDDERLCKNLSSSDEDYVSFFTLHKENLV